jgi:hypothetical protein
VTELTDEAGSELARDFISSDDIRAVDSSPSDASSTRAEDEEVGKDEEESVEDPGRTKGNELAATHLRFSLTLMHPKPFLSGQACSPMGQTFPPTKGDCSTATTVLFFL